MTRGCGFGTGDLEPACALDPHRDEIELEAGMRHAAELLETLGEMSSCSDSFEAQAGRRRSRQHQLCTVAGSRGMFDVPQWRHEKVLAPAIRNPLLDC